MVLIVQIALGIVLAAVILACLPLILRLGLWAIGVALVVALAVGAYLTIQSAQAGELLVVAALAAAFLAWLWMANTVERHTKMKAAEFIGITFFGPACIYLGQLVFDDLRAVPIDTARVVTRLVAAMAAAAFLLYIAVRVVRRYRVQHYQLIAASGQFTMTGHSPAFSIDGPERSELRDFKGNSQCRRLPDGRIEIAVQEQPDWGRRNEPLVRNVLQKALTHERGAPVEMRPQTDEEDGRGFDGFVRYETTGPWTGIQTVAVPSHDKSYAAQIAKGDNTIILSNDEAAQWIAKAIQHKVAGERCIPPASRGDLILALDLRHASLLADDAEVRAALDKNHPGVARQGFAAVWLVASTERRCRRLA